MSSVPLKPSRYGSGKLHTGPQYVVEDDMACHFMLRRGSTSGPYPMQGFPKMTHAAGSPLLGLQQPLMVEPTAAMARPASFNA